MKEHLQLLVMACKVKVLPVEQEKDRRQPDFLLDNQELQKSCNLEDWQCSEMEYSHLECQTNGFHC